MSSRDEAFHPGVKTVRGVRWPNFFVAGVPKAGTTSLHSYLAQHPQIFMSPVKEPMFFGAADLLSPPFRQQFLDYMARDPVQLREFLEDTESGRGRRFALHPDAYTRLFDGVENETAIGEASIDYFWLPSAAQAIRERLPEARLIFVLRNPVEKLFSSFLVARRVDPTLAFRPWFVEATRPGSRFWPLSDSARYATHLERFLALFPREHIRVYLFDAYRADPRATVRDICAFLGVDPDHEIDFTQRRNEGVVPRAAGLHRLRRRLFGAWAPTRGVPEPARGVLRRLYYRDKGGAALSPEERGTVVEYYRDEMTRTERLLDCDLSRWRE